jgi:hypothetical protein
VKPHGASDEDNAGPGPGPYGRPARAEVSSVTKSPLRRYYRALTALRVGQVTDGRGSSQLAHRLLLAAGGKMGVERRALGLLGEQGSSHGPTATSLRIIPRAALREE